ncbi:uncharacterized protein LOC117341175 [Pecten maximus]|uniref:uncharacterized protein LOC117341175 n=1 Tax=Pecten maximus TaxID=6579 RepID=UPI0014588B64|nr:uncharacterized protein LOC117341175 [Pecten maximus]
MRNFNKIKEKFYSEEEQQHLHNIQRSTNDQIGVNGVKESSISPPKENIVHDLQSPKLVKDSTTKSADQLNGSESNRTIRNDVIDKLHIESQDPNTYTDNNFVDRSINSLNNAGLPGDIASRLNQIQHVYMQNQEALAHNQFILHDQLVEDRFDMPEENRNDALEGDGHVINKDQTVNNISTIEVNNVDDSVRIGNTNSLLQSEQQNVQTNRIGEINSPLQYEQQNVQTNRIGNTHSPLQYEQQNVQTNRIGEINSPLQYEQQNVQTNRIGNLNFPLQSEQQNVQTNRIGNTHSPLQYEQQNVQTNRIGEINSPLQYEQQNVQTNRIGNTHSPPQYEQQNIENRTQTTYDCENPRHVPHVENILCMDKPQFLPNYKNPCWRDGPMGVLRCLPYFHIFGTCKSGTTDLFLRMIHHPQILPNSGILSKETWFWSWKRYDQRIGFRHNRTIPRLAMTLQNFTDYFDAKTIEHGVKFPDGRNSYHKLVTGHGDPMDIWDFTRWRNISQNNPMALEPEVTTPHLIHHVNPDIKLIALLREPAERAYSHYLHLHYGDTKESFHYHVLQTISYLKKCEKYGRLRACVYKPGFKKIKAPLHASLYYLHLTEWLKVFPRNQILLLTNEDYHRDTAGTLRTVFRHLNLDQMPYPDLVKVASRQKQYVSPLKARLGAMLPQTKAILGKYFEDSIHKLVSLLNDTKYLKWIDKNSPLYNSNSTNLYSLNELETLENSFNIIPRDQSIYRKLSRYTHFNKRNAVKFNRSPRNGFLNAIQFKLPSNNIPRADLPSNIIQEFNFHPRRH